MKLIKCFLLFSIVAGASELPSYMQNVQSPEDVVSDKKLDDFQKYFKVSIAKDYLAIEKKDKNAKNIKAQAYEMTLKKYNLWEEREQLENFFMAILLGSDSEIQKLCAVQFFSRVGNLRSEHLQAIQNLINTGNTNDLTLVGLYSVNRIMDMVLDFPVNVLERIYKYRLAQGKLIASSTNANIALELMQRTDSRVKKDYYIHKYLSYADQLIEKSKPEHRLQVLVDLGMGLETLGKDKKNQDRVVKYYLELINKIKDLTYTEEMKVFESLRQMSFFRSMTKESAVLIYEKHKHAKTLDRKVLYLSTLEANEFYSLLDDAMIYVNEVEIGSPQHIDLLGYLIASRDKRTVATRIEHAIKLKGINDASSKRQYIMLRSFTGLEFNQTNSYDEVSSKVLAWWDQNKDKPEYHYNPK